MLLALVLSVGGAACSSAAQPAPGAEPGSAGNSGAQAGNGAAGAEQAGSGATGLAGAGTTTGGAGGASEIAGSPGAFAGTGGSSTTPQGGATGQAGAGVGGSGGAVPLSANVLAIMKKVADYQLGKWGATNPNGWVDAAGWTGILALYDVSHDTKYLDAAKAWATKNNWALTGDASNADNQCAAQVYFDLYLAEPSAANMNRVTGAKPAFDAMLAAKQAGWGWVDSLYMSPPGLARLYAVTKDAQYLPFLFEQWNKTKTTLYSATDGLWWRDPPPTVASGKPRDIFWSRGNGWVMAASVRVLQELPAAEPQRSIFVDNLHAMAQALVPLQQADGTWHSDLLHPAAFPTPESSGSAFFTYAMAYGINTGLLDKGTYLPIVTKAWAGLQTCVQPSGLFGFVQPPNWAPGPSTATDASPYGVGAFLLAGSEVAKLVP